jgi:hypothetical protein
VTIPLIVCVGVVVLGIAVARIWSHRARIARESRWLPDELTGATLAYAERTFTSRRPWLVAKVDRGYRKDGLIWLTELKTRKQHRVHLSDVVEMSAQRVAVEAETGAHVSAMGYVVTQVPGGARRLHRVDLLDKADIENLIRRRVAILDGALEARYASYPASCAACAYRAECSANGALRTEARDRSVSR